MKKYLPYLLNSLSAYQLFGGILGIGLALRLLPQLGALSTSGYGLLALAIGFYTFSIAAGAVLFRNRRSGLTLSLINQALQVISLSASGFAYQYVAGFKIGLGIFFVPLWQFKLQFTLSSFQFMLNAAGVGAYIGINVVALGLVYLVERLREELKG